MITAKKIASNATWYIIALSLQKVVSFIYFTYLARYLGPADTGKYFFAVSLTAIFSVLTDVGMSYILTREVAKYTDENQGNRLLSQIVSLKIVTTIIVVGLIAIISPLLTDDAITRQLIIVATASMILDGFTLIFYSAIRGRQNLGYESFATIIHQVIIFIVGLILIKLKMPVQLVIYSLLAASLFNFTYSWLIARNKLKFHIRFGWDKQILLSIYSIIIPFALAAIFTRVYAYIDTLLLQAIKGSEAVGYYSVAYKITFAFQFLPLAFVAALYPAFSYFWQHDRSHLYVAFSKSLQYLIIISVPISVGLITLAPTVIPAIYTESFRASVLPLQALLITLPFLFLNFPMGSLLNACSRQKWQTTILAIGMVVNIVSNLTLINILGATGAAMSSTISTMVVFIISIVVIGKVVDFDRKLVIKTAIKTLLLAAIMAIAIIILEQYVKWYLTIIPAILIYLLGIWLLGLITKDDLRSFKGSLNRG